MAAAGLNSPLAIGGTAAVRRALPPRSRPADAELLLMLVEGAWIVGRVQQSKAPLHRAAEAFLAAL